MTRIFSLAVAVICMFAASVQACNCGGDEFSGAPHGVHFKKKKTAGVLPAVKIPPTVQKAARQALRHSKPNYRYDVQSPVTLFPERVIWVRISATDANRIVCTSGRIVPEDVVTSKEKGVVIEVAKNGYEAYLKLRARQDVATGKLEYPSVPVDVYVSCGGETYGFIGRPKKIPSRTIYLVSPSKNIDRGRESLKSTEVDRAVVEIWKHVLRNDIPSAWEEVRPRDISVRVGGVLVRGQRSWRIPGVGVLVRELSVSATRQVRLRETDFLRSSLTINPFALLVEKPVLAPGERTRAIVLEKGISREP